MIVVMQRRRLCEGTLKSSSSWGTCFLATAHLLIPDRGRSGDRPPCPKSGLVAASEWLTSTQESSSIEDYIMSTRVTRHAYFDSVTFDKNVPLLDVVVDKDEVE